MLDDEVEVLLRMWGQTEKSANRIKVGYGNSPIARAMQYARTGFYSVGIDIDQEAVDRIDLIMRDLEKREKRAYRAVRLRYINVDMDGSGLTDEQCASRYGASRSTFQSWLKRGRDYIASNL